MNLSEERVVKEGSFGKWEEGYGIGEEGNVNGDGDEVAINDNISLDRTPLQG